MIIPMTSSKKTFSALHWLSSPARYLQEKLPVIPGQQPSVPQRWGLCGGKAELAAGSVGMQTQGWIGMEIQLPLVVVPAAPGGEAERRQETAAMLAKLSPVGTDWLF